MVQMVSRSNQSNNSTSPTRLLLVDDDPTLLEATAGLLTQYGYDVRTASNGQKALLSMKESSPALVISDINMPIMDGYEFYQEVRKNPDWATIPFIFLTGRGTEPQIREGQRLGADAYLIKPFDPEYLLEQVQVRLNRMEEIRQASQKSMESMQQDLLDVFGHELRTPLTYIYGYINLLQGDLDDFEPDAVERMMGNVRLGAERLVKLVEDLMLLVQLDSDVIKLEMEHHQHEIVLDELFKKSKKSLNKAATETNHRFEMIIEEGMTISGIPLYLKNILHRLVDNGFKFSEPGTLVSVKGYRKDDQAILTVSDEGIGIPADQIPAIHERFHQAGRSDMEQQGIGIGLTLVHEFVKLHGGTFEVDSTVGEGSTFTVSFPLVGPID